MKKFLVYVDDGHDCYKIAVPANTEAEAKKYVEGNGEVIAVKEIYYDISSTEVANILVDSGKLDKMAIDFILRALEINYITD